MPSSPCPPVRSIQARLLVLALALATAAAALLVPAVRSAAASSAVAAVDPATGSTVSLPADAIVIHVDQSQAARFFPQTGTWADGSAANPFPNLAQGVWQAQQLRKGGAAVHVVVAPGIYREKVEIGWTSTAPGPLVLEASVPGTVVVTGADVEQRWTSVPGTFLYSAPWMHDWGLAPVPSSWGDMSVDDLVRRREGVYVDSQPLEQVGTQSELAPGKFLVDEAADQIVMAPPAGVADLGDHVVEVTARDRALRIHGLARSVAVRGFTFEGAAPGFVKHMVYVSDSTDVLIEGNLFRHSTWAGLGLAGVSSVTVRDNHATDNGGNGIDTYKSHNLVVEGNRIERSNLRGLVNGYVGWSTAGSKNMLLHGAVFRHNTYEGNFARGLWFDTDVKDVLVDGDRSCANLSDGVFIEKVQGPLTIRGATFCGNNGAGIRVGTSGGVRVEGSTVADNRYGLLFSGNRHSSWYDHVTGVLVEMGDFADWTLVDNVFVSPGTPPLISSSVIPIADWRALLGAGEIVASGNTFTRTPLEGTIQILGTNYSLAEWAAATGDTAPEFVVVPTAPTNVVATFDAATESVVVSWTAPPGPVTDYAVLAYDMGTGYVVSHQTVTTTSATFTGLTAGRSYAFGLYAQNEAGYSPGVASNVVAVPDKASAPAAPTNVVAATTSAKGTVKVTWTAPAGPVTSYVVVAYDAVTGAYVSTKTVTSPTATFSGLTARRTYIFTVRATNDVGTSPVATSNKVKVTK